MSGLPTLIVTLDDGTGSFPYDVSSRVRLSDGATITRGRSDQQSAVNPSSMTFTLENLDGHLTPGDPTYGLRINQRLRFSESVGFFTYGRFDGYIQSIATSWPDGGEQFCVTTITAADLMTVLSRTLLRSVAEHEFLADAPDTLYALNESSGAVAAGDSSGNQGSSLTVAGTGTAPAFGTEVTGTAVATNGVLFAAGQYLSALAPGGSVAVEIVFATTDAVSSNQQLLAFDNGTSTSWQLQVTGGTLQAVRIVGGSPTTTVIASGVADGQPHVVFAGGASGLYLDGVAKAAGAPIVPTGAAVKLGSGFNGTLALAATYSTTLSSVRVAAHATAILDGFTADSSDARITRLLGYAGVGFVSATTFEAGLQTSVPAQQTAGVTALDAIQAVANGEGGLFYVDPLGGSAFQNRAHRPVQTSPDWSIVAIDTDPGTAYTTDTQNFVNYVTAKSVSGAEQIAQSAASIAIDGQYAQSLDLLVGTDAEALDQGNWLVNTRSIQRPKLPAVVVDLMTATTTTFQQAALSIDLSDRIHLSGMPSQTPATGDLIVEGWTETIATTSWQMTFNTSAFAPYNAAAVNTSTATCDTGSPVYF